MEFKAQILCKGLVAVAQKTHSPYCTIAKKRHQNPRF